MPSSFLLTAAVAVVLVALWALLLDRLGLLTPSDVRAWRRLASLRGYERPQGRIERAARRSVVVRRLQDELDLRRLLGLAGRTETEGAFLARTAFIGLLALAASLAVDVGARIAGGDFPAPPWVAVLVAVAAVLARLAMLGSAGRRRCEAADRALGDMMMLVAVVTDGRGLHVHDAVRILARCAATPALATLIDRDWQRLVETSPRSTVELYRAIAAAYGTPTFGLVADALTTTNVGVAERDTFTRVASAVYAHRLSEARMRAARARILVTLPVAGMLVPLLLLLGAPTLQILSAGLGGG